MRAAGRDVLIAASTRQGEGLPAGRCLALGGNPAVTAAGGITEGDLTALAKAPGEPMALRGLVGELPAILTGGTTDLGSGIGIIARDADRLGVADGGRLRLTTTGRSVPVTTLDLTERVPDPGAWLFEGIPPSGRVSECWAEVAPGVAASASDSIAAWLKTSDSQIVVTPLLAEDRLRQSPTAQYEDRPTRDAWLAGGGVLGLVFAVILWFRRAEVALYRTVGVSRPATTLVHAGQYLPVLAVGTLAGAGFGIIAATRGHPLTAEAAITAARQAALVGLTGWTVTIAAALALTLGRLNAYIRDRL